MMRDEIWTICSNDYASKPRPAIIIQDDDAADIVSRFSTSSRCSILPKSNEPPASLSCQTGRMAC